jgi:peptidoglycan/LPS O-acetylase OafA/YrhL
MAVRVRDHSKSSMPSLTTDTADAKARIPSPLTRLRNNLAASNIPSLDGLRAISVVLVILVHLRVPYIPDIHGVLTFFVLSGFLITWLLLKESGRRGAVSIKDFYARRALRIFPAFYAFWFIHLGLYFASRGVPTHRVWFDYLTAFFYVSDYRLAFTHVRPVLSHTWSLSVEEQFYLIWPWIFVLFQHDLRKLTRILVGIIAAVYAYRIVLFFVFHVGDDRLHSTFDGRADHLFIGCLLAVLLKRGVLNNVWSTITSRVGAPILTLAALVASIALNERFHYQYKYLVGFSIDPLLIALFLVQVVALGDAWLWRWLNWPIIRYVGRVSYPMYLYHGLANDLALRAFRGRTLWLIAPAAIVIGIVFASTSYFVVEKPFLRLKSKFSPVEAS